ncbi:AraC family transcriptional regulator [Azonexus sp.]|jgi:AraC family transcriptional regulator|uniref:helix-turn-helix transcriptional regulator n=1 Tax=Azonexus sp. TaxID=1872668 RepID=UPI00281C8CEA|nr:AraC family transcriptional regulator [Azonexus sp.]MDR1994308.1 AraC family transcriptional regulator [Azonexus sp.]
MMRKAKIPPVTADGTVVPAIHTQALNERQAQQWGGFVFKRHLLPPGMLPEAIMAEHCFVVPLSTRCVPIEWRVNGRLQSGIMTMDRIFFLAAGDAFASRWHQPLDVLFVSVSVSALQKILGTDMALPRLYTHLDGISDAPLLHTIRALHAHMREHRPGERLLNETLLAAIGLRLVDLFGQPAKPCAAHSRQHASPALLGYVEDYIHAHMARNFSIADIAGSVNLSTFHLCKVFKKAKGISLWQYVLRCRIEQATRWMRLHPADSLTAVALASGFESYTQFLSAFRKYTGTVPRQFRAQVIMAIKEQDS